MTREIGKSIQMNTRRWYKSMICKYCSASSLFTCSFQGPRSYFESGTKNICKNHCFCFVVSGLFVYFSHASFVAPNENKPFARREKLIIPSTHFFLSQETKSLLLIMLSEMSVHNSNANFFSKNGHRTSIEYVVEFGAK